MDPTVALFRSITFTLGIVLFLRQLAKSLALRPPHRYIPTIWSRDGTLHRDHVVIGVHAHDFQVSDRDLLGSHTARHFHAGENTRWKARCTDRPCRPMEHGSVTGWTTTEVVPLHEARKTAALTGSDDIHDVFRLERFGQN